MQIDAGSLQDNPFAQARRAIADQAPLSVLLALMVVLGIALRVQNLSVPAALKWDEHHYVETARSYLAHQYVWNDHPPLSKLIIAGFMKVLGDRPLSWRLPSLLFGLGDIALIGLLARRVFGSVRAGWIAAAFVAADGFFIAYSRTALLDGMTVAFGVAGILNALYGRTVWRALGAGVFVGCAASFKLNGLVFVAVAVAAGLASRDLRKWTPVLLGAALLVFYAQCAAALINVGRSGSVLSVIHENREMVRHHLSYTVVHPYSSHWYTWFLPTRPIFLRRDRGVDGVVHALLTLGNPILWWGSTVAVVAAAAVVVRTPIRRLWQQLTTQTAEPAPVETPEGGVLDGLLQLQHRAGGLLWMLALWAGPIVFWIPSLRDSYVYHYLPSYAFALPLLAGFIDRVHQRRPLAALVAIALVAEVSVFYAPLWGELPISQAAMNARLFPLWR